ncbi:hypothetical protein FGK63_20195 [Ruegeria sediminis]|uniref:Extracellular solute-binding protein n=1 Tax=Ruegeria sediminis TaxID=2583820 RepID=A0ABY2WRY2_9RHOB|nr:hypothetical protein [Ruegeria sediminis]TMV02553.1 hypothetical protein FGK63_20195 [Ruegeria sediminis]
MTLNRSADGPFAFADATEMAQYDAVEWLIDCVVGNNDNNGASWSDWTDAQAIISTYEPAHDGAEYNGKISSRYETEIPHHIAIGDRGHEILNACIAGADPEPLMDAWREEISSTATAPAV